MSEGQLLLTNRLYRYIKASAVIGIIHAGVELVTNADDAYRKSSKQPPYNTDIIVDYKKKELTVFDQAIGLNGEEMKECFGQVGNYTSTIQARGYFSRGAKDITAIGNATFVGIKDGKITEVTLSTNDIFTVKRYEEEITDGDRSAYKIVSNGLWCNLAVKDSIEFPNFENMANINRYFSMRDIFSNTDNVLNIKVINENGLAVHDARLQYVQPEIKATLIDETFTIDGYPGITASFKLYLYKEPVKESEYTSYSEYGVLVSSGNAIHEISTFYSDIKSHPYIKHICGRLECSYINQLMYDFDRDPDDVNNPFPIIDHSRLNGLDRSHPFTKALFRIPHKQLSFVLQDLHGQSLQHDEVSGDLSSLFKNVELFGADFFREMAEHIHPYAISDVKTSKIVGYLTKKTSNIVSTGSTSTYNFQDETTFVKKSDGDIAAEQPTLVIIFTEKEFLIYPYYIYRLQNKIYLEININDFMVSKYIYRSENGEIALNDKEAAGVLLVDIISEAMAREALKEKEYGNRDEMSMNNITTDYIFNELEKIKALLVPKLYHIIVTRDMQGVLISNE